MIPCDKNFGSVVSCNEISSLDNKSPLIQAMATCHSLTRIGGEITGDPLDLVMFNSINWVSTSNTKFFYTICILLKALEEPEGPESEIYDKLAPTVVKPLNDNELVQQVKILFFCRILCEIQILGSAL